MKTHGTLGISILALALLAGAPAPGSGGAPAHPRRGSPAPAVTPMEGESWIRTLGVALEQTSLGRMGRMYRAGVAPASKGGEPVGASRRDDGTFVVSGHDLYRYSCQACHNPQGTGLPPLIHSMLGPVQSSSAAFLRAQMAQRGFAMPPAQIRQLATQAQEAIDTRLEKGGQNMPPFSHLDSAEKDSLLGYVRELAEVPGAEQAADRRVVEPTTRVGELIVKGTCRICHDSTGEGRMNLPEMGRVGKIPSLANIVKDLSGPEVVRKVREGWPFPDPHFVRGEMPIFNYLSPDEVKAVYTYLLYYPPREPQLAASHPVHYFHAGPGSAQSASYRPHREH